jgi:hypothetical protein
VLVFVAFPRHAEEIRLLDEYAQQDRIDPIRTAV